MITKAKYSQCLSFSSHIAASAVVSTSKQSFYNAFISWSKLFNMQSNLTIILSLMSNPVSL